ncbi:helix-turn-helix transcriptional regulator [Undibacterium sp. Ren11W]|uniref:helix-turn-helix transcriptional regulator n=1 Tax=Undibacterium sp. Ren11W TaxID=3413045 RepID=UPI003BF137A6
MANPTTRILALLELLQSHGRISGAELARRLELEPRSIRRYIQSLETLGIPIQAQRGRDGGYSLMQGFKLPPMMFSNDETVALALGLIAARSLGWDSATLASASAQSKLERVMPETVRLSMQAVAATVTLESRPNSAANQVKPGILSVLSIAIQKQQGLRLIYRSARQITSERAIESYALTYFDASWYLLAYCHVRLAVRSFRLDRIESLELLPTSFGKPVDFDPIAYLNTAIASLPRAYSIKVLLHTDLSCAHQEIFSSLGILELDANGTLLHGQADDLSWMARELARLPFSFTILAPPELRVALAQHLNDLLTSLQTGS